jgi:hypothetical protein
MIELKTRLKEKNLHTRSKISSSEESYDNEYLKAQIQELKTENQKIKNLYELELGKRMKLESQINLKYLENHKFKFPEDNKELALKFKKIFEENLRLKNV